jgi:hypothetical protein
MSETKILFGIPAVKKAVEALQDKCSCGKKLLYKAAQNVKADGTLSVTITFADEQKQALCEQSGCSYCSDACHEAWHALPEIQAAETEKVKWGSVLAAMVTAVAETAKKGQDNLALKMCHDAMRGPFAKIAAACQVMGSEGNQQQKAVAKDILANVVTLRGIGATCAEDLRYRYDEAGNCTDLLNQVAAEKPSLT